MSVSTKLTVRDNDGIVFTNIFAGQVDEAQLLKVARQYGAEKVTFLATAYYPTTRLNKFKAF